MGRGLESRGKWQGRGNDALVLTADYLHFFRFAPILDARAPVGDYEAYASYSPLPLPPPLAPGSRRQVVASSEGKASAQGGESRASSALPVSM